MRHNFRQLGYYLVVVGVATALVSCASKILEEENVESFHQNKEFENLVKVKELPVPSVESQENKNEVDIDSKEDRLDPKKVDLKKSNVTRKVKGKMPVKIDEPKKSVVKVSPSKKVKVEKRQPEIEDSEGFNGRIPLISPYTIGERVTMALKYFKVAAGYMTFETRPMAEVNGRMAYHFAVLIKSSRVFSMFYKVDDWAETFVDSETLVPLTMGIHVNETKQARDIRSYFDWKTNEATYWEKKVTEDKGEEEKKMTWKLSPYSQNVVSAAFYLRNFIYRSGKTLAFPVSDDGKNFVFSGKVLRRETLKTEAGEFDCFVIKPELKLDGVFKPVGDVFMWITNDKYRTLVRLEAKIKIGTVIGEVIKIERP